MNDDTIHRIVTLLEHQIRRIDDLEEEVAVLRHRLATVERAVPWQAPKPKPPKPGSSMWR